MKDPYIRFYEEVFERKAEDIRFPSDYRETVQYILTGSGLNPRKVKALMGYFGIGEYEGVKDLDIVGADMNIAGSTVRDIAKRGLRTCALSSRKRILEMGITEYLISNRGREDLPGEIVEYQRRYQELDNRRHELLNEVSLVRENMSLLLGTLGVMLGTGFDTTKAIAKKEPVELSMAEIDDLIRYGKTRN